MSIGALLIAIAASALGALAALADGALLALDSHEPLEPSLAALRDRRERVHRAMAFMRLATQLVAGLSVALDTARPMSRLARSA